MKKALVIFSVLIITLLCSISVFAMDTDDSGMWEYKIYGNGVEITGYNGEQTDVYIPSKITKGEVEYSVLKLGDELFKGNATLNSATLGEGITEIGASAFEGATNLVCIVTPESLETIGDNAFSGCTAFNSVILYDAATSIGENAFSGCPLLKIYGATGSCAEEYATANNITFISISENTTPEIYIVDGVEYYIQNGEAIAISFDGSSTEVTIPSTVEGYPVTELRETFDGCATLTNVTMPDSITSIGSYAFRGCTSLSSITIPVSVTSIGSYVFSNKIVLGVYENSYAHTYVINRMNYYIVKDGETAETIKADGITYILVNGTAIVQEFDNSVSDVIVPCSVEGVQVTYISAAFNNCTSLTSITIPDSVTSIGSNAFNGCTSLSSITIGDGVTSIGSDAFRDCTSLTSITIPDSVTSIGGSAFNGCTKLGSITIGDGVTSIRYATFYNCTSLSRVTIGNGVASIDGVAFSGCTKLGIITIPDSVTSMDSISFPTNTILCVYKNSYAHTFAANNDLSYIVIVDGKIPEVYTVDGVAYCIINGEAVAISFDESTTTVTIPSTVEGYPVTNIRKTFYNSTNLISITIPDSVTSIGEFAFYGCTGLKNITIPDSVTSIGKFAFTDCTGLKNITIPDSVTSIGGFAFHGCTSLSNITIPDSVTSIGSDAFNDCTSLVTVYVYKNSYAHTYAIKNNHPYCIITEDFESKILTLNGITYSITNSKAIATGFDDSVKDVTIPAYVAGYPVTSIGGVFNSSSITSITIPDSVTEIGGSAFSGCTSLTSVTIPDSVTTIGNNAFYNCTSLTSVTIPDSVTTIGNNAFYNCTSLVSVIISDSVTIIRDYTFGKCTSLKNVTIPESVNIIVNGAFEGCTSLEDVKIPDSVNTIDVYVFSGCTSLASVIIPKSVTYLADFVFCNCTNLKSVLIPDSVSYICYGAFEGCTNLANIVISQFVESMEIDSFPNSTVLYVYENSYAHTFAVENNLLYFVLHKTMNPEIAYGKEITGTARYTDRTPAKNATVEILYDDGTLKESVTTDSNGNYEFTYAEVGRYTIRVTDTSGNTASEVVSVKRMNVFDVYLAGETDLVLKKGYNVSGTVLPIVATITISDTNGNIIKSLDTTNGAFTFGDIPRGTYIVKAENETGSATTEIYVSNEDVTGISIEIQAHSATITGETKIENRDGTYSVKIWVNIDLIDENGNVVANTKTDAEGKYTFKNLPVGSYNIVATATEIRPDIIGGFHKNHELKGYGHIDVTEFITYTVDTIVLREEKINLTSVSGKVTANGTTQDCQVILTNENGDQIAVFVTDKNGKYNFVNIPDGMYCITAITKNDGMGFAVITIKNSVVHGDTDIKVAKADKISKREPVLLEEIPNCETTSETLVYKEAILGEKAFYDSLSDNERKQLSQEWIEKLFKLIALISDSSIQASEGVTVENVESVISSEEIDETIEFALSVTEVTAADAGEDGITTEEEYETEKIKDKKGKNKEIAKYYDITFSKDGQNISNIQKQTETNGKLRITMDIPEEYRGHKHYSFIHMHKGEAVTLVDLDDDPNTVTFEIDKFSTFALAYSDVELVGEVREAIYPASITYNAETGKISVSSTETGKLYIATYDGERLSSVAIYDVTANVSAIDFAFASSQVAFVWDENLRPLCEKFTISN